MRQNRARYGNRDGGDGNRNYGGPRTGGNGYNNRNGGGNGNNNRSGGGNSNRGFGRNLRSFSGLRGRGVPFRKSLGCVDLLQEQMKGMELEKVVEVSAAVPQQEIAGEGVVAQNEVAAAAENTTANNKPNNNLSLTTLAPLDNKEQADNENLPIVKSEGTIPVASVPPTPKFKQEMTFVTNGQPIQTRNSGPAAANLVNGNITQMTQTAQQQNGGIVTPTMCPHHTENILAMAKLFRDFATSVTNFAEVLEHNYQPH